MKKTHILLASVAALTLSAPTFAKEVYDSKTEVKTDAKGNYEGETTTKSVDAAGTKTKVEKEVDVDVDTIGDDDKTVTTKVTTDPKGLMNKTTVKTKDKVEVDKDGKITAKHKKTVNGDTVEDTETVNPAR